MNNLKTSKHELTPGNQSASKFAAKMVLVASLAGCGHTTKLISNSNTAVSDTNPSSVSALSITTQGDPIPSCSSNLIVRMLCSNQITIQHIIRNAAEFNFLGHSVTHQTRGADTLSIPDQSEERGFGGIRFQSRIFLNE